MHVKFADSFEITLRHSREETRREILAWVEYLKNWESFDYARRHSEKLDPVKGIGDNVYALTGTEYVIFFKLEKDAITVLDATGKSWLDATKNLAEAK